MSRIAYNIAGAAKAASVPENIIVDAVKERKLAARLVGGRSVILHADIQAWLKSTPDFMASLPK